MRAFFFAMNYNISNYMIPGVVENFITILDLEFLGVTALPKKWIMEFIKGAAARYKARGVKTMIVQTVRSIRWFYAMVSPFIDERVKIKTGFYEERGPADLTDLFHPSQLEEKFGGTAPDITENYWPPPNLGTTFNCDRTKLRPMKELPALKLKHDGIEPEEGEEVVEIAQTARAEDVNVEWADIPMEERCQFVPHQYHKPDFKPLNETEHMEDLPDYLMNLTLKSSFDFEEDAIATAGKTKKKKDTNNKGAVKTRKDGKGKGKVGKAEHNSCCTIF